MHLGNIYLLYMVPANFGHFFSQIFQKWPIFGKIENVQRGVQPCSRPCWKKSFRIYVEKDQLKKKFFDIDAVPDGPVG